MSLKKHPNSRWVKGIVPRYDPRLLITLTRQFKEGTGWHNGARVVKR